MNPPARQLQAWIKPQLPVFAAILITALLGVFLNPAGEPSLFIFLPLLLSLILFGLPHGAADDQILARIVSRPRQLALRYGLIYLGYILIALIYLAFWWWAPVAAFLFFIVLTWFHWGQGDVFVLRGVYHAPYLSHRWLFGLSWFLRGALPMGLTWICFPGIYHEVWAWTVNVIPGSPQPWTAPPVPGPQVSLVLLMLFSTLVAFYIACIYFVSPKTNRGPAILDSLELILLSILFASIHPLVSIGIYFCIWHGLRHIIRLEGWFLYHPQIPILHKFTWKLINTFPKTIINTSISLGFLILLYFLLAPDAPNFQYFTGIYLILIATLTLPHVIVVSIMDFIEFKSN